MHLGLGNSQKAKRFRKFVTRSSTKFDGSDGYVDTGVQPDFIHTNATMAYWVKMGDLSGAQLSGTHNGKRFYLGFYNATAGMGVQNTNNLGSGADLSSFLKVNTWHHIAMVAEGGTATFYLDGVARDTLAYTQNSANNPSANLLIGAVTNNGSTAQDFMNASIDEFAVFSSALTAREIDALYNNGQPTKIRTNPNLAHWYRMGEGKLDGKSDGDENLLFDQGPNGGLSSEKVTNGDLSTWTDTDTIATWNHKDSNNNSGGGVISQVGSGEGSGGTGLGSANFFTASATTMRLTSGVVSEAGKSYQLEIEVSRYVQGIIRVQGAVAQDFGASDIVNGKIVKLFTASSATYIRVQGSDPCDFTIDNVSLKEVQNVGTLVNAPEIQADGGTELVTNGTFDTDVSGWAAYSGGTVTWSAGTAITGAVGTDDRGGMTQTITTVNGRKYTMSFQIISRTATKWEVYNQTANATLIEGTDLGAHKITFTAAGSSTQFSFYAKQAGTSDGTVAWDNISVKEVTESVPKQCKNLPSAGSAKSMAFDGTDDFVDCGTGISAAFGDDVPEITVSMWVNVHETDSSKNSNHGLFSIGTANFEGHGEVDVILQAGSNRLEFRLNDVGYRIFIAFDYINKWQHLCFVFKGGDADETGVYIDGVRQTPSSTSGSVPSVTDLDFIGRKVIIGGYYSTSFCCTGSIDEVAIWDTVLDADAVKALYNAGEPTPVTTKTGAYDIYRDNLQAYYKMGDASDPAADGTNNLLFDQTNPGEVEMITNGDFSNGTTDWTTIGGGALSVVNGKLRVTSSSSYRYAYQLMTTRVGGVYSVTVEATKGTSPNYDSFVGTGTGAGNLVYLGAGGGSDSQGDTTTQSGIFTATTTTSYLMLRSRNESSVADAFTDFDNVSVKEYNGHTGVINNATIQTEAPKQIYALPAVANTKSINFDGSNDHLVTQVDKTLATRYYSFWAKSSTTSRTAVWDHGASVGGVFFFNWGDKPILYNGTGYYIFWNDNPAQDDGEWHHWTVYQKHDDIAASKLWCDGVLQTVSSTSTGDGAGTAFTTGIKIGSQHYPFNGSIDEFSIHEDLDDESIRSLFNRGRPIDISSNHGAYDLSDKALHWWRMGDATSPAADGTNDIIFQGLEAEGSEEVTNGDFSNGATGWTPAGSLQASASDGALLLTHPDAGTWYGNYLPFTSSNLVAGRTYKVTFDAQYVSGTQTLRLAYNSTVVRDLTSADYDSTFRTYEAVFTATFAGSFRVFINGGTGSFKIDNVSIKQLRGQYIGVEEITNGDFSSSSNWTLTGTAEITGGVANWPDATNSTIYQNANINLAGIHAYRLEYDVVTTNGSSGLRLDGGSSAFATTSIPSDTVGRKTVYVVSNGSQAYLMFNNSAAFVGSIDNVSLKPVGGSAVMTNMTTSDIQTDTPY